MRRLTLAPWAVAQQLRAVVSQVRGGVPVPVELDSAGRTDPLSLIQGQLAATLTGAVAYLAAGIVPSGPDELVAAPVGLVLQG